LTAMAEKGKLGTVLDVQLDALFIYALLTCTMNAQILLLEETRKFVAPLKVNIQR
jgi:hypothetical protein